MKQPMTTQRALLTVTLDEETVRWVRMEAARRSTTVSTLIGKILRERMEREVRYEAAMRQWLSGPVRPLTRRPTPVSREELHARRDRT
jgi:hypothetical protein